MSFPLSNIWMFTYFDTNTTDIRLPPISIRQQDILRFEVPVDDTFAVQDTHGCCNLVKKHSDGVFTESSFRWWKRSYINI